MNRNKDNNSEAVKIANALKPFVKKWFDEWGQSCLRSKKMTVTTAPNGSVIGVTDAFSNQEIFIKYMSSCANATVGDTVWCKWMYDNMQTLYADKIGNLESEGYVPISGGTFIGDVDFDGAINTSPSGVSSPSLDGNLAHTGDYIESNPSNVNVDTSTWTTVASITLTEGKWLTWYTARFNDSTYNSGRRMSIITTSDTSTTSHAVMLEDNVAPVADQSTYCKAIDVQEKRTTSTYYLRVWHNAGATIGVTARLHAIRIC